MEVGEGGGRLDITTRACPSAGAGATSAWDFSTSVCADSAQADSAQADSAQADSAQGVPAYALRVRHYTSTSKHTF